MGSELGNDLAPDIELSVEHLGIDAIGQIEVHFDRGILILIEIGAAKTLGEVPCIDGLEAGLDVQKSEIEVQILTLGVIGAVQEIDLIGDPLDLAGNLRVPVTLRHEFGCAITSRDIEDRVGVVRLNGLGLGRAGECQSDK